MYRKEHPDIMGETGVSQVKEPESSANQWSGNLREQCLSYIEQNVIILHNL
jgi:hypothetical protein